MKTLPQNIVLIDPYELLPHERIRIGRALYILSRVILSGQFALPLFIDLKTKTILDGHHRAWVARRLGFKNVPCYYIDYLGDRSIEVYSRRPDIFIDKQEVVKMALSGGVFPHKTTRHVYDMPTFEPLALGDFWNYEHERR